MQGMFILFGEIKYEGSSTMGLYTSIEIAIENCRKYRERVKGVDGFDEYVVTKLIPNQPYDEYKRENVVARFNPRKSGEGWQFTKE